MAKNITDVIKSNLNKLRKPSIQNGLEVRQHAIMSSDKSTCLTLTYNNRTGELSHPMEDGDAKQFSQVMVEYVWGDSNVPYTLRQNEGQIYVHRMSGADLEFGIVPGDVVIDWTIEKYNMQR